MGERDDRIEALKQRQADIGAGPDPSALGGALGGVERDYRNARDVMPLGPERDAASTAATTTRANLLEELARVEGELGDLERGKHADWKAAPDQNAPLDASQPVTDAQIAEASAPAQDNVSPEQPGTAPEAAAPDVGTGPVEHQRELEAESQDKPEAEEKHDEQKHQDWEKLEPERALHTQHLTEIAEAEGAWRSQLAAAAQEMKKLALDHHGERPFQNNEFTGAADRINRLFNGQDQQRESLYANNVAENETVRGVQMIERAAMHESMVASRLALTVEMSTLEATQKVAYEHLNQQDAYRQKLTREGMDASIIDRNVEIYGQRLALNSMDQVQTQAAVIHEATFPQVHEQAQQLALVQPQPTPQPQQAGPTL
jgi:hypothetical protein